jgi:hypothetical protein
MNSLFDTFFNGVPVGKPAPFRRLRKRLAAILGVLILSVMTLDLQAAVNVAYPYENHFDTTEEQALWLTSGNWGIVTATSESPSLSGDYHLDGNPDAVDQYGAGEDYVDSDWRVTIPQDAVRPVLTYGYRLELIDDDMFAVQIRVSDSAPWMNLAVYEKAHNHASYARESLNLSDYRGETIQLRLKQRHGQSHGARLWAIDDLRIGDESLAGLAYPYSNGFETASEMAAWNRQGAWEILDGQGMRSSRSGNNHLDNNPQELDQYANNGGQLATLNGVITIPEDAVRPVLSYWYQLGINSEDYFAVDIRTTEDIAWTILKSYEDNQNHTGYARESLDLSAYRGHSVQLRFRQRNSYNSGARLWLIDDLWVGEETLSELDYPYENGFETLTEQADWSLQGIWGLSDTLGTRTSHTGGYHLDNNPTEQDQYGYGYGQLATLQGLVAIPADATRPVLSFWYQLALIGGDMVSVEIRPSDEIEWTRLKEYNFKYNHTGYTRESLDLSEYRGRSIQVRFTQTNDYNHDIQLWILDDLSIGEETLADLAYPYANGFETTLEQTEWNLQGTWATSAAQGNRTNHSGAFHLDNNPAGLDQIGYDNGQYATLNGQIAIPQDALSPVFSYWYKFDLDIYAWYCVDIRTSEETAWTELKRYYPQHSRDEYVQETLDLSAYRGHTIQLRFRQDNGYDNGAWLWLIDDLWVGEEQPLPVLGYPYANGFETTSEQADWNLRGLWNLLNAQTDRPNHAGSYHLDSNPSSQNQADYEYDQLAILNGVIPIPADAPRPVLSFWYQLETASNDTYSVEIRAAGDTAWQGLTEYSSQQNHTEGYARETLDLSAYRGQSIQVRFQQRNFGEQRARLWLVDDLWVGEETLNVLNYPYKNGFETPAQQNDWNLQGAWGIRGGLSARTNHAGSFHLDNNPEEQNQFAYRWRQWATLNGEITIPTDAIQPALNFWYRLQLESEDEYHAEIRRSGESEWNTLKIYTSLSNNSDYQLAVIDLDPYRGQTIQLRFSQYNAYQSGARLGLFDDLSIGVNATYDQDGDGTPDIDDADRDGDGVDNTQDAFPDNPAESADLDGDGIGDNSDPDRDGDGVANGQDLFPNNPAESADLDGDGVGDNSDPDRDGDGIANSYETQLGFDPNDAASTPADFDGDHLPDALDDDRDGDGVANDQDLYPEDPNESSDMDGDGIGDNSDPDRDGDGFSNEEEAQAGTNPDNGQSYPDQVAPQLTLDGLAERITDAASIELRGGVSDDNSGVAVVTLVSDRYPGIPMAVIVDNGEWSANVPLEIGINLILLTALDQVGNQTQLSLSVERQSGNNPLALVIDYPENDSVVSEPEIVIRGLFRIESPAETLVVMINGTPMPLTATDLNTEFRFQSEPQSLSEGVNQFTLRGEADSYVITQQLSLTYNPEVEAFDEPQIQVLAPLSGSTLPETSFTLAGEVEAPGTLTSLTLNGSPIAFTDLQGGIYAFRETLSFEQGSTQLNLELEARDAQNQVETLQVDYSLDQETPLVTLDRPLSLVPTENSVTEQPYRLQGTIQESNLSSFTVNDQVVALVPGDVAGTYRFDAALQLSPGEALPLRLSAQDQAGNQTMQEYLLRLDTSLTLKLLLPVSGTELVHSGTPIALQVAAEVEGVGAADVRVHAELLDSDGITVANTDLAGEGGVHGGELSVPAQAGNYEVRIALLDSNDQALTTTRRSLSVTDPVDVPLALEQVEPADNQSGVEPNTFISLSFNQPIDTAQLSLSVYETAHGFTYQDLDEPGTSALEAQGYQLVSISRSHEPVPGNLSVLPGDRVIAFYAEREFAYNAEIYVDVSYAGEELYRGLFRTRPLPTFINGTVVDQFGQPVGGITVSLPELGRTTQTNSDGAYAFGYHDRYDQGLPGGRYELRINPGLEEPHFGSLSLWASIQSGRLNTLEVAHLPVLNKDVPFAPVQGRGNLSLLQGALKLDLTQADLLFPDGARSGDLHLQFSDFAQLPYPVGGKYLPHWVYTAQPSGVQVEGAMAVDLAIPSLNHSYSYLPDDGDYVLMLGVDPQARHIVPVGVARIDNYRAVSVGIPHYQVLGYALMPREAQPQLQAYANGELDLRQLLIALDHLTEQ